MWAGHYAGFKRRLDAVRSMGARPWLAGKLEMTTLAMQPRLFQIDDFLSPEECDSIMATAATKLERSGVLEGNAVKVNPVRTSSQVCTTTLSSRAFVGS